ncbi:hypothetical protein SCWH03_01730 [Streptomyces pacificus]|uniref:DJ-1/PfpI domain-containing protein n=1 Tax=Streptomyces pacificus TaxID=2705029 RepID=A0A6A0AMZ7_9ACTN|nr:hypothetical protein SCWH03_01730 [Streptomyces pacificus]
MSQDSAAPEAVRKLSGRRRREVVAVLLFSGGPIFESSIPLSVFGIDRQDAGVPRYRLLVCAGEEGPLRTTGGLELTAPYGLEAIGRAGTVVVPAWRSITSPPPPEALEALRRAHEEGARIVGLCTGAFVLAAAGLLDSRPATTHWMYAPTLAKRYPSVHVDPRELFVDDGDVLTSAGTAAGIDLCLHIVRSDHGADAAGALARRLVVPPRRSGGQERYLDRSLPEEIGSDPLAEVVAWALEHLHEQFDVETLAARAYMSRRNLRPQVPLTHRKRSPAVADHPAGAAGAAAARDLRLLGRRGRGALRLPLPGGAARALPPPAGFLPGCVPGGLPGQTPGGRAGGVRGRAARHARPDAPGAHEKASGRDSRVPRFPGTGQARPGRLRPGPPGAPRPAECAIG